MAWKNHTEVLSNGSDIYAGKVPSLAVGICGLVLFPVAPVILCLMLFVYKTYKTTFQRLIIYYVALSLWLDVSAALLIVGAFTDTDGEWICNIQEYLLIRSQFAWYTYIIVIANFSLFLTVYLTRLRRGRPLSKRSSRFWECICIISPVAIGLTVASAMQIYSHAHGIGCTVTGQNLQLTESWGISLSLFLGIDLEVILVSVSLCIYFYFIRQRIQNGQTTVLLQIQSSMLLSMPLSQV